MLKKIHFLSLLIIGSALKKEAANCQINGGSLKRWVNTRWHTMFDCVDSIQRHKEALIRVCNVKVIICSYRYYI